MLKTRIFTSLLLMILIIIVFFIANHNIVIIFCLLSCLLASYELLCMYQIKFFPTLSAMVLLTLVAVLLYLYNGAIVSHIISIIIIFTWGLLIPSILYKKPKQFSLNFLMVLMFIILLPTFYTLLILYNAIGPLQLISLMASAWTCDIGAYFIGKKYGKHKLAKTISPNKSIEGAIGGILVTIIYFMVLKSFNLTIYLVNYFDVIKFAIILSIVGIMGDLLESWFKRVAGVKDSGHLLPGHGGVFDRIDSLLAVVPVAFVLLGSI